HLKDSQRDRQKPPSAGPELRNEKGISRISLLFIASALLGMPLLAAATWGRGLYVPALFAGFVSGALAILIPVIRALKQAEANSVKNFLKILFLSVLFASTLNWGTQILYFFAADPFSTSISRLGFRAMFGGEIGGRWLPGFLSLAPLPFSRWLTQFILEPTLGILAAVSLMGLVLANHLKNNHRKWHPQSLKLLSLLAAGIGIALSGILDNGAIYHLLWGRIGEAYGINFLADWIQVSSRVYTNLADYFIPLGAGVVLHALNYLFFAQRAHRQKQAVLYPSWIPNAVPALYLLWAFYTAAPVLTQFYALVLTLGFWTSTVFLYFYTKPPQDTQPKQGVAR
ncbi:MAG: hypothetical protein HY402_05265, partial [Elusimicrobia bacterium]|nr:hypothetical protein [Elusimicrobiota bacterium]